MVLKKGRTADCYLEADQGVISSLDRGYAKKKTLSKQITRNRNSLARLAARGDENSIGYDILREFLEKKEKELSKIIKRNGGEPNKQINLRGDKRGMKK